MNRECHANCELSNTNRPVHLESRLSTVAQKDMRNQKVKLTVPETHTNTNTSSRAQ